MRAHVRKFRECRRHQVPEPPRRWPLFSKKKQKIRLLAHRGGLWAFHGGGASKTPYMRSPAMRQNLSHTCSASILRRV